MNQEEVGMAYRIGSRKYNRSSEAVRFAAETAKVQALATLMWSKRHQVLKRSHPCGQQIFPNLPK